MVRLSAGLRAKIAGSKKIQSGLRKAGYTVSSGGYVSRRRSSGGGGGGRSRPAPAPPQRFSVNLSPGLQAKIAASKEIKQQLAAEGFVVEQTGAKSVKVISTPLQRKRSAELAKKTVKPEQVVEAKISFEERRQRDIATKAKWEKKTVTVKQELLTPKADVRKQVVLKPEVRPIKQEGKPEDVIAGIEQTGKVKDPSKFTFKRAEATADPRTAVSPVFQTETKPVPKVTTTTTTKPKGVFDPAGVGSIRAEPISPLGKLVRRTGIPSFLATLFKSPRDRMGRDIPSLQPSEQLAIGTQVAGGIVAASLLGTEGVAVTAARTTAAAVKKAPQTILIGKGAEMAVTAQAKQISTTSKDKPIIKKIEQQAKARPRDVFAAIEGDRRTVKDTSSFISKTPITKIDTTTAPTREFIPAPVDVKKSDVIKVTTRDQTFKGKAETFLRGGPTSQIIKEGLRAQQQARLEKGGASAFFSDVPIVLSAIDTGASLIGIPSDLSQRKVFEQTVSQSLSERGVKLSEAEKSQFMRFAGRQRISSDVGSFSGLAAMSGYTERVARPVVKAAIKKGVRTLDPTTIFTKRVVEGAAGGLAIAPYGAVEGVGQVAITETSRGSIPEKEDLIRGAKYGAISSAAIGGIIIGARGTKLGKVTKLGADITDLPEPAGEALESGATWVQNLFRKPSPALQSRVRTTDLPGLSTKEQQQRELSGITGVTSKTTATTKEPIKVISETPQFTTQTKQTFIDFGAQPPPRKRQQIVLEPTVTRIKEIAPPQREFSELLTGRIDDGRPSKPRADILADSRPRADSKISIQPQPETPPQIPPEVPPQIVLPVEPVVPIKPQPTIPLQPETPPQTEPFVTVPVTQGTPFLLPFGPGAGLGGPRRGRRPTRRKPAAVLPSLGAVLFDIRGERPAPKGGVFTGQEFRPITTPRAAPRQKARQPMNILSLGAALGVVIGLNS